MGVVIEIIVEGTITGIKNFSGEIVAGILFTVLFFLFPNLRKFFNRKKYDTGAEGQKNMEILRQDIAQLKEILKRIEESKDKTATTSKQTHHKDEDRVKAELQRKQEELKQAEEAERVKNIDEILMPFETIRQKPKQAEEAESIKNIDEILLPFETIRQPKEDKSQHKPESTTLQSKVPLRVQRKNILPRPRITQRNSGRTRENLYSKYQRLHQTKPRKKSHSFLKFFTLLVLTVLAFMLVKSFLFSKPTDAEDQYELGYKYFSDKNYAEALKWYTLSAEQGLAQAQFNLGLMYENGLSVQKDVNEARKWYQKSAAQEYSKSKQALERLK